MKRKTKNENIKSVEKSAITMLNMVVINGGIGVTAVCVGDSFWKAVLMTIDMSSV